MTNTQTNDNATPFRKRINRLNVSVFENVNKKGEIYFSTYIQRRYNSEGTWKEGPLSESDLEDLLDAKRAAEEYIAQQKERYSTQQLPQPGDPSWVADAHVPSVAQ